MLHLRPPYPRRWLSLSSSSASSVLARRQTKAPAAETTVPQLLLVTGRHSPPRCRLYSSRPTSSRSNTIARRRQRPRRRPPQRPTRTSRKTIPASSFVVATVEASSSIRSSSSWIGWYETQLEQRPLVTKSLTSGIIAGAGDVLCQAIVVAVMMTTTTAAAVQVDNQSKDNRHNDNGKEDPTSVVEQPSTTTFSSSTLSFLWNQQQYDSTRTLRFVSLGTFLVGPVIHVWYNALNGIWPGTTVVRVVQRVLVDQFIFTPAFLTVWLTALWTLQDWDDDVPAERRDDYWTDLRRAWPVVLPANWCLWIPAQAINFRFVPLPYQVLFSNVVALVWNAFLSFTNSRQQQQQQQADDMPEQPLLENDATS